MHNYIRCFFALAAVFLASCTNTQTVPVDKTDFKQLPAINLNVGRIDVVDEYQSPRSAPNIEHNMPVSPAKAMRQWVKDRLHATGSGKIMQITIIDAPVVSSELPRTQGVKGLFTIDQEKKYEAKLEVSVKIYGEENLPEAETSVVISRSTTIPENATANYRKAVYDKLVTDLMNMLNEKLEHNIRSYLGNYVTSY